jgi:hypothetical protein
LSLHVKGLVFYKSFQYSLVLKLCIMLSLQVAYLRRISSISRIQLTDGRRGEGKRVGENGAK